jgi:hypothetical protein
MGTERRNRERRRDFDSRRATASTSLDVTRIEHENLCSQVAENVRVLRRLEQEIQALRELLERPSRLNHAS